MSLFLNGEQIEEPLPLHTLATPVVSVLNRQCEYIDSGELAVRWALPESWIRDQVRARAIDPLPHVKFGKYVRFRWGSPELEAWAERRIVGNNRGRSGNPQGR